ncbi:protein CREG2 isoform X1 [Pantherophis guttatus]|uniref:Protein CREG2 isoform X1 n=1 Tax=Pantherophis guttatus TaxID=94885 RepID=A0ABM3Z2K6_PANGU|nr:protein CREG2 isoform X1 [Pantherophis guttatus]
MPGSCSEIKLRGRALCVSWLSWALWGSLALAPACGYVIVNSVSWSVPNEVEEELDSSSNEEALPALLEDTSSIWKQSYPASVYKEEEEMRTRPGTGRSKQISSPSRMFSYRKESSKGADSPALPLEQAARTARFLMHRHGWGFLATTSTQEKIQGAPFGTCLSISDGPSDNSTGIPYFYMTPKDKTVADLVKNSIASLTLPEAEGDFCRKTIIDPDDPKCTRLTFIGNMVTVPPEELESVKQALFSRHPIMRKWPRNYEWFFMKMNIEHIWLQD